MMTNITVDHAPKSHGDAESRFYGNVTRCVDEGRTMRFVYQGPLDEEPFEGELKPYLLHFSNRAWYVLGHSDVHDDVRMFKLMRFLSLQPTGKRFKRPKKFSASEKLGDAWQMIPGGKVFTIELIFAAKVATNVSEVKWHPSQKNERLKDGRCRVTFRVDGLEEISWWICGYAQHVEVIRPTALRKLVCEMHTEAAKMNANA